MWHQFYLVLCTQEFQLQACIRKLHFNGEQDLADLVRSEIFPAAVFQDSRGSTEAGIGLANFKPNQVVELLYVKASSQAAGESVCVCTSAFAFTKSHSRYLDLLPYIVHTAHGLLVLRLTLKKLQKSP